MLYFNHKKEDALFYNLTDKDKMDCGLDRPHKMNFIMMGVDSFILLFEVLMKGWNTTR